MPSVARIGVTNLVCSVLHMGGPSDTETAAFQTFSE